MENISFSRIVKKEICELKEESMCCQTAFCYGIICFAKEFNSNGLSFFTEQLFIARYVYTAFKELGFIGEITRRKNKGYEYSIKDYNQVEKLLTFFDRTGMELNIRINSNFFTCQNCYSNFISAAFLLSGVVKNPQKGYALEFSTNKFHLSEDFVKLLQDNEFTPKISKRKSNYIIYFRASEQIEDLLVFMKATNAAFEIMNSKVYKEVRNNANRIANSEMANINKTISATEKYLKYINFLEINGKFASLNEELKIVARLRKKHPEYTLQEIGKLCEPALSKSGVSHRLKKIESIAEGIKNG